MRKITPDLLLLAGLLILPLILFAPVTLGGKTLIPADNLYQFEPWASAREAVGAPAIPHNALLSDLVLQNFQWKTFIRQSVEQGVIPLWQTEQFAGTPFLAAGQHAALYPFSVLFLVLPLPAAYGWFTVSQLWLAGALMYLFARGIGRSRIAALVAGVAYQLSAFFVVSAVFPMMIAGAAWLPLLLLMIEFVIEQRPLRAGRPASVPWIAIGALALMMNIFAGHVEITYYTLIVMAYYAAARLIAGWWRARDWRFTLRRGAYLLAMVALGLGLGAAQFIPLYELGTRNFREDAADFSTVQSYALPERHVLKFVMPDAFGNPADHEIRDVFTGEREPLDWTRADGVRVTDTAFGVKNYVEGGAYLGILALALAAIGLFAGRRAGPGAPPYRAILGLLALVSLTFAFGLPTYALLYYLFPNLNQLHTPFRWVWPLTFCAAALAAFGVDALAQARRARWPVWIGAALAAAGALILGGLLISRAAYDTFAPLIEDIYSGLAGASGAFPDARTFYSYQFWNVLALGAFTLAAGGVILLSRTRARLPRRLGGGPLWAALAALVIGADLLIAGWGFNPAADPAWLDFTPASMNWLRDRMAVEGPFRFTTLDQGARPLHANSTWRYGLHDARGYDSMIPRQYTEYMSLIAPQGGLLHNRIDPIAEDNAGALASPLLDLLNVRYVVSDGPIPDAAALGYEEVYADSAVTIYENMDALPRAYTLPYADRTEEACGAAPDSFAAIITSPDFEADPRRVVIEGFPDAASCELIYDWPTPDLEADPQPAAITSYGAIEVTINAGVEQESWLVLADSYYPGWRAYVRPQGAGEDAESALDVQLVNGNFRGVRLEPGEWTVRFRFSPPSFQIGAFASFLSGMLILFMLMLWGWRQVYRVEHEADSARRIAKNSLAPIVLNLFNRGIDFAFAFIMLRILGPKDAGIYYYAIVVFGWFDILTNFGLNTLLTREVARDRAAAGRYLFNSTVLRLALAVVGVPLLVGFLLIRQTAVTPTLEPQAILAIGLLYAALLPGTISTGLTALFYAFEKAEYPAATTTVSTIVKVTLGLATLLLGWGAPGLAGGAIATNLVTLGVLAWLARPLVGRFVRPLDAGLMRHMLGESWPLMINHLLATVFFKIDIVLMEAINGNVIVGQYSTAYKWLDALNIIPAYLTMALLPVMARQAHGDRPGLRRHYTLAVKLLVMIALPVAVVTTFLAEPLIRLLGGAEYLPAGGVALQIMIWSIPIGWINSVTNYVIVALDRQRTLTLAFLVGVTFNIVSNLIFLPIYSYRAAAVTTILSELVLLIAFTRIIRQELGGMGWRYALWRPALAALVLGSVLVLLWPVAPLGGVLLAAPLYAGVLLALRPFRSEELARIAPLLPGRLRRWALRGVEAA